jgi:hypothetical protein
MTHQTPENEPTNNRSGAYSTKAFLLVNAAKLAFVCTAAGIFSGAITGIVFRLRVVEIGASGFLNLPISMNTYSQWAVLHVFINTVLLLTAVPAIVGVAGLFSLSITKIPGRRSAITFGCFTVGVGLCGLLGGLFASHFTPPVLMDLLCGAGLSAAVAVLVATLTWRLLGKLQFSFLPLLFANVVVWIALGLGGWLLLWDARLARMQYYRNRRAELQLLAPRDFLTCSDSPMNSVVAVLHSLVFDDRRRR